MPSRLMLIMAGVLAGIVYSQSPTRQDSIHTAVKREGLDSTCCEAVTKGFVYIDSEPRGAAVLLDSLCLGLTPVLLSVATGSHDLTLQSGLYVPHQAIIHISKKDTLKIMAELLLCPASIHLQTVPDNARVFLDDEFLGYTPLLIDDVEMGDYEMTIKKPGYKRLSAQTHFTPGETKSFSLTLTPRTHGGTARRSLLVPGWGQWYAGSPRRAIVVGTVQVAALAGLAVQMSRYDEGKRALNRSRVNYHNTINIALLEQNRLEMDRKYRSVHNQWKITAALIHFAATWWIANVVDAYFLHFDAGSQAHNPVEDAQIYGRADGTTEFHLAFKIPFAGPARAAK